MKPLVYLARHGETEGNALKILKGGLDFPLDENGLEQAVRQADELEDVGITKIFSSPALRALQSAQFLADRLHLEIIQDRGLGTLHMGVFEGVPRDEASEAVNLFIANPSIVMPLGQSIEGFEEEVANCAEPKLTDAEKDGPYAFYTHNSWITALSNMLKGQRHVTVELGQIVGPGGICVVYPDAKSYQLEVVFDPEKHKETRHERNVSH